jgi:hypothetical protein
MRESGAAATGEGRGEMDLRRVRERVLAKGFTVQQLEATLEEYASIDVSFPLFSSPPPPWLVPGGVFLSRLLTDNPSTDLANCRRGHAIGVYRNGR